MQERSNPLEADLPDSPQRLEDLMQESLRLIQNDYLSHSKLKKHSSAGLQISSLPNKPQKSNLKLHESQSKTEKSGLEKRE